LSVCPPASINRISEATGNLQIAVAVIANLHKSIKRLIRARRLSNCVLSNYFFPPPPSAQITEARRKCIFDGIQTFAASRFTVMHFQANVHVAGQTAGQFKK
jgi:hypothetical protein